MAIDNNDINIVNSDPKEVSTFTANQIKVGDNVFTAHWETEGLCVPIVYTASVDKSRIDNRVAYVRISREEIVKMFKDIQEKLSHE